jgi:hypothetical protein
MTLYNKLIEDGNWIVLEFTYPLLPFIEEHKTPSDLYRKLSNGLKTSGRQTNRDYFKKEIVGGMYLHSIENNYNQVKFLYLIQYKPNNRPEMVMLNLAIRIKKIMNTKVRISTIDNLQDEPIINLLKLDSIKFFQRFGELYSLDKFFI